jgi:4-hydroxy-3-methylbut-2-en-1-yl diphosphate reductase
MTVNIDENAGFCWGVVRTIDIVEKNLKKIRDNKIFILGQIIHNPKEVERLESKGLITINKEDFSKIANQNAKVIIRAHGEPPETYKYAKEMGINIIDATCPLVKNLQKMVSKKYDQGWQIVVFGKKEHAEIKGLQGVCNNEIIVVSGVEEALEKVDFNKKSFLFSQTTMNRPTFYKIKNALEKKASSFINEGKLLNDYFDSQDTVCHFVYGREDNLKKFCKTNDLILFVAGRNSSNGKSLYNVCKTVNDNIHFIEDYKEIDSSWFEGINTIGITGATSTPQWYMDLVKEKILDISEK